MRPRTAPRAENSGLGCPRGAGDGELSADLRKEGTAFDLPIALVVLGPTARPIWEADDCLVVGELG